VIEYQGAMLIFGPLPELAGEMLLDGFDKLCCDAQ
jgi:hypothetical protein